MEDNMVPILNCLSVRNGSKYKMENSKGKHHYINMPAITTQPTLSVKTKEIDKTFHLHSHQIILCEFYTQPLQNIIKSIL